jgi:cytoskeletal protein RodZ
MEIIIVAVAILAVAAYFILRRNKDIPESVVKTEQAAPAPVEEPAPVKTETVAVEPAPAPTFVPPVTTAVKETNVLDLNKDGKVDLADAKEAVKQTVAKAKTATSRAKKKK